MKPHAHARALTHAHALTLSHKMCLLAECEHDVRMHAPDVLDDPAVRIADEVQTCPTRTHSERERETKGQIVYVGGGADKERACIHIRMLVESMPETCLTTLATYPDRRGKPLPN